jgi:transcriptional regulator with XRE-family HTH domain
MLHRSATLHKDLRHDCQRQPSGLKAKDDMPLSPLPSRHDSHGPVIRRELAQHVRAWRTRLDPDDITDLRSSWVTGRRRRNVSQQQAAQLIGCSTQWFANLELGHLRNYSDSFLNKVAEVLRLDDDETRLLYLLVGKQPPALPHRGVPADLEPVLMAQPWPAYLSDHAWDIAAYNEKMRSLFPWVRQPGANVMQWVFTDPDARRRLYRWDTDWAPHLIAQLRVRHLRFPNSQRLHTVVREILAVNADTRRLWEQPLAHPRQGGDRRSILLPGQDDPYPIRIVALEPSGSPGHRMIMLVPVTG